MRIIDAKKKIWSLNALAGGLIALLGVYIFTPHRYDVRHPGVTQNPEMELFFAFAAGCVSTAALFPLFFRSMRKFSKKAQPWKILGQAFSALIVGPLAAWMTIFLFFLAVPVDMSAGKVEHVLSTLLFSFFLAFITAPFSVLFGVLMSVANIFYLGSKNYFQSDAHEN